MGYPTYFQGEFKLNKPLAKEHRAYLVKFGETRRTKHDARRTSRRPDPVREAAGLPVGPDGAYFVGGDGIVSPGQPHQPGQGCRRESTDIASINGPPNGQPTHWCGWVPNEDGTAIIWNENEKFFMYVEWLAYLIEAFLEPWGYVLNGVVGWRGGDWDDVGVIVVIENKVKAVNVVDLLPGLL